MRLADLLLSRATDADGNDLGQVHEVVLRLEDKGPAHPRLFVDGVIVGAGAVGRRLGYLGGGVEGPWVLSLLFRWVNRGAREVPWSDLTWIARTVRTKGRAAELSHPEDRP